MKNRSFLHELLRILLAGSGFFLLMLLVYLLLKGTCL